MNLTAIQKVVEIAHRMDAKNLVNTYEGNISTMEDGLLYITPSAKSKSSLTAETVAVIDLKTGKQISGPYKPSSELPMHTDAYKVRDDIKAVIHCHPPYLTAHAICNVPVKTKAYPEMIGLFKEIKVAAYGRPGTEAIFAQAKEILKTSNVVLLANHGALVVADSLDLAYSRMEAAEAVAQVLFVAKQFGTPVDLPEDEVNYLLNK